MSLAGRASHPPERTPAMGEKFWNGLGIVACLAAGIFAVVWMSTH